MELREIEVTVRIFKEEAEDTCQQRVGVFAEESYTENEYNCPICSLMGRYHRFTKGTLNCPCCGVNLVFDEETEK